MTFPRLIPALAVATLLPLTAAASVLDKYTITAPLAVDSEKMLFSKIFDIELWSDSYPQQYDQDITIRIRLAARVDKSDIIEFILDEAGEIHKISRTDTAAMLDSLDDAITCLPTANTVLDFNFIPGTGVEVSCNGEQGGPPIADEQHTVYLMDIFLHPKSEYPGLAKP